MIVLTDAHCEGDGARASAKIENNFTFHSSTTKLPSASFDPALRVTGAWARAQHRSGDACNTGRAGTRDVVDVCI